MGIPHRHLLAGATVSSLTAHTVPRSWFAVGAEAEVDTNSSSCMGPVG